MGIDLLFIGTGTIALSLLRNTYIGELLFSLE